jgi:membrane dipeptidase
LTRFRELGGLIGVSVGRPFVSSSDELRARLDALAQIPYEGRTGYEGIAIGTSFLDLEHTVAPLENAPRLVEWLCASYAPPVASALIQGNARKLLLRATGSCHEPYPA